MRRPTFAARLCLRDVRLPVFVARLDALDARRPVFALRLEAKEVRRPGFAPGSVPFVIGLDVVAGRLPVWMARRG